MMKRNTSSAKSAQISTILSSNYSVSVLKNSAWSEKSSLNPTWAQQLQKEKLSGTTQGTREKKRKQGHVMVVIMMITWAGACKLKMKIKWMNQVG